MKTSTLILGACMFFSLNSCSQDFKKINDSDVDKNRIKIASDFASNFFSKLKNGETYKFQNEAIDAIRNSLTEENQKTIYKQIKDQFGDYQKMEYAETWVQNNNKSVPIFRFKGEFDKSRKKLEIRVVLNESDKIAGFWIKPWSDILN